MILRHNASYELTYPHSITEGLRALATEDFLFTEMGLKRIMHTSLEQNVACSLTFCDYEEYTSHAHPTFFLLSELSATCLRQARRMCSLTPATCFSESNNLFNY
jgi:hypothetical protein